MKEGFLFKKLHFLNLSLHILKTRVWYKFFLKKSGKKNTIINPIVLTPSCIILGDHVLIRNNGRLEGIFNYQGTKYSPEINIGDNVTIEQNAHITCACKIYIGNNTAIAANVTITDIDHPYLDITLPPERQTLLVTPVQIGEDCKIYNNAVILPGTILGKHTVVAANAVILGREYPAFCVLAGIPAKIVKQYDFTKNTWLVP